MKTVELKYDEEKEKQIARTLEYIKAVPDIPRKVTRKMYKAKCPCGGTLTAWRVEPNGHLRCSCDKCDFILIE